MAGVTLQVVGFDQAMVELDKLIAGVSLAGDVALVHEAERELALSQPQVPVHTGALKATGRVEPMGSMGSGEFSVGIVYGSGEVDYAVQVHEDLEAHHPQGKAKYLEDPVREEWNSGRAAEFMAAEIERSVVTSAGAFLTKSGSWLRGAGGQFVGSIR